MVQNRGWWPLTGNVAALGMFLGCLLQCGLSWESRNLPGSAFAFPPAAPRAAARSGAALTPRWKPHPLATKVGSNSAGAPGRSSSAILVSFLGCSVPAEILASEHMDLGIVAEKEDVSILTENPGVKVCSPFPGHGTMEILTAGREWQLESLAGVCSGSEKLEMLSSSSSSARGEEGSAGAALCLQVEHRNEEMHQLGDPQQEMGKLPGSKTEFPARVVLSEEEKLKVKLWELERTEL